ncbi:MAG: ABC transporter permease [Pseudonocardiaceae bacterium]
MISTWPHRSSLVPDSALLAARYLRLMTRRPASLVGALVLPLMFTLLFFAVFQRPMIRAGIDYAQYLLPAVIIQAVFFAGISAAVFAAEDASGGVLQRLRGMPIARAAPAGGLLVAEVTRALVATAVLIPVGLVLGFRFEAGVLAAVGFVALVCLFALTVCAGYLTLGLWASRPDTAAAAGNLVFLPLLLASDAFTTTEAFPDWLEPMVGNQPVSRVADALRALSTEGAVAARPVLVAVSWLVPLLVLFGVLAAHAFGRRR